MAIDVNALRALIAAATPRPWYQYESLVCGPEGAGIDVANCALGSEPEDVSEWTAALHDAALIVAAVNALPGLLDELERLQAIVDSDAEHERVPPLTIEAIQAAFDQRNNAAVSQVEALTTERDEWKRRAQAHGCDLDKGDPDCG